MAGATAWRDAALTRQGREKAPARPPGGLRPHGRRDVPPGSRNAATGEIRGFPAKGKPGRGGEAWSRVQSGGGLWRVPGMPCLAQGLAAVWRAALRGMVPGGRAAAPVMPTEARVFVSVKWNNREILEKPLLASVGISAFSQLGFLNSQLADYLHYDCLKTPTPTK